MVQPPVALPSRRASRDRKKKLRITGELYCSFFMAHNLPFLQKGAPPAGAPLLTFYFLGVTALRSMSTGIMVTARIPTTTQPMGAKGTQLNMLLTQPHTATGTRPALTISV